ncbi:winged helix DNA-binding domain-containing protein [Pseudolysinimonas sp.]|uniref:winged helix DNA-binding domain-containing protein n=1 Tax=Pseudolysinimonas sp. TaxID=2680009 RepID=UPI003F8091FE
MADFTRARRRITALRLTALGVARPSGTPAEAVRSLLAMQAQDLPGALWSVGLRSGATRDGVVAEHEAGGFVRSWPMRGTLHLVAPDDLPWLLDLTGGRAMSAAAGRHRQLGIEATHVAQAERIALRVLDGATATRAELLAALEHGGVDVGGQRGAHLLLRLAQLGVVVMTARDRWARLDAVAPSPIRRDRDEALRELALRYFVSHGPATVADLAWWAGLTLAGARAGTAAAREGLEELVLDGTAYLHRPGLEPARPAAHLLPGFDENLLGYTDRSAPLAGEPLMTVAPGSNGMFLANVVVDGEIVGLWRRKESAKGVHVEIAPFRELGARAQAAIARASARYARYLGVPLLP